MTAAWVGPQAVEVELVSVKRIVGQQIEGTNDAAESAGSEVVG